MRAPLKAKPSEWPDGSGPKVLLITPPMVQFNTPYAATPALTAYLRREGVQVEQADLSLELALQLFSKVGLERLVDAIRVAGSSESPSVSWFLRNLGKYLDTVDEVVSYLQCGGRKTGKRIAAGLLPKGPRFRVLEEMASAGVSVEQEDPGTLPRLLASLYVDDLADVIRDGVDPLFSLARYGDRLATSAPSFGPVRRLLAGKAGPVAEWLDDLTHALLRRAKPDLVGVTLPFPGCVYGAFRIARCVRMWNEATRTVVGGGYVNTELRSLSDCSVFDYFDFVTYDDGEVPLLRVVEHVAGRVPSSKLVRTRFRSGNRVVYADADDVVLRHGDRPAPVYDGLPLGRYCGMTETANPMARLWTEQPWLKLAMAHGCYWHKCAFCDTKLDYIRRFDPAEPEIIVEWMERLMAETGRNGFHFVDEAAPPALVRRLSERLIERGLDVRWWTNVRFDPAFDGELAACMAQSGCIAVTGGLECAEKDLLGVMCKGITLAESARALHCLVGTGILTHAYLMYGFPGQTLQQTVDSLEFVRQLFAAGCLDSAYWHRFALTVHSSIFENAGELGIRVGRLKRGGFARNEAPFRDRVGLDHDRAGVALRRAVYNFMHGVGLDADVREWFDVSAPRARLPRDFVDRAIEGMAIGAQV